VPSRECTGSLRRTTLNFFFLQRTQETRLPRPAPGQQGAPLRDAGPVDPSDRAHHGRRSGHGCPAARRALDFQADKGSSCELPATRPLPPPPSSTNPRRLRRLMARGARVAARRLMARGGGQELCVWGGCRRPACSLKAGVAAAGASARALAGADRKALAGADRKAERLATALPFVGTPALVVVVGACGRSGCSDGRGQAQACDGCTCMPVFGQKMPCS